MNDFPLSIFEPYLSNQLVTDINYNGHDLWIDHLEKGRIVVYNYLNEETIMKACIRFSNLVNQHFNFQTPLLEADYDDLRVSILHPSVSGSLSISVRKTPIYMRIEESKIIDSGYVTREALEYLKDAVTKRANIMVTCRS